MTALLVRNLDPETHRALKERAARNGRSIQAELRAIISDAVSDESQPRLGMGTAIRALFAGLDTEGLEFERDKTPARYVDFE